uniref:Potassium/proton antiporter CemA n=4 Tax=Tsuga TaxID=3358 RepID=A0A1Y0DEU5_9CONI|nr:putative heme-binding protein [Tsuga chinensis]YP_009568708.1 putative heme-binding protein [Tsuga diversifolia]YP_009568779.1 putative heme-binding protein [Tsuga sieboldii]ART87661.1 CemA [Tsuga ulleungensis]ART87456.1 CemA [Tsuga diversifolia]ART87591.1 CemA [Tsuga sieboldii]QBB88718.1 putative heme-binding protein [Tsuga diversifolia]QBB88789.1 putative heme-binding protein [Tsuga sieboldii]
MGFIPHSITRTLSRFRAELTSKSGSLTIHKLKLVKYKTSVSLRYIAGLVVLPWLISISFQKVLEPWVRNWWNTVQYQNFFYYLEEKALIRFNQIEELFLLERILEDSSGTHSQDLGIEMKKRMIPFVKMYNEECIQIILNILTSPIGFASISAYLILGKKKLAIINSWIQELFYSLSDTMKAFCLVLASDIVIGFHSPDSWKFILDFLYDNYGLILDEHLVSCFISTFPVIADTIMKYWIFIYLNRISPSLVVIYHLMNE